MNSTYSGSARRGVWTVRRAPSRKEWGGEREEGALKQIRVDPDILDFLASKASRPDEPLSDVLRRELHLQTVEVDDDLYDYLISRTVEIGEPASQILRRELHLGEGPVPVPEPGLVVFHIPGGTGEGPWNTRDHPVHGRVGGVLRIVNDDVVTHRLHTDGAPFPHPAEGIRPGQSADFVLQTPFDGSVPLQDHDFGPNASFFLVVLPAG